jgi:hypothetical protein
VRAEHIPQPFVATLPDQVQIDLAQRGQPAVRVITDLAVVAVTHPQPVVTRRGHKAVEKSLGAVLQRVLSAVGEHRHLIGTRAQHTHRNAVRVCVGAEHRMRIVVLTGQ